MKKLLTTAAALTVVSATAAFSNEIYADGHFEYATEASAYDANVGLNYEYMGLHTYVDANFDAIELQDMTFSGTEIGASFDVTSFASLYGAVELDDSFGYAETTVGIGFKF